MLVFTIALLASLDAHSARAQEADVLIRLLRDGDSFRVRARAALALGRGEGPRASAALERALDDQHAAVRAAAATSLGRIGGPSSVPALRAASRDPAPDVAQQAAIALRMIEIRNARAQGGGARPSAAAPATSSRTLVGIRYAVVIGDMRNDSGFVDSELLPLLADRVANELRRLGGVAVFTPGQITDPVERALARRKIPRFRVEGNVRSIQAFTDGGDRAVRAEISLLLLDDPGRNLRSMLRGAATGSEGRRGSLDTQERLLARRALENAVRSAMTNAGQAMDAASVQRDASTDVSEGPAEAALARRLRRSRQARP